MHGSKIHLDILVQEFVGPTLKHQLEELDLAADLDYRLKGADIRSLEYNPYNPLHNPLYIYIAVSIFSMWFSIIRGISGV